MGQVSRRKLAVVTGASQGIGYELARQALQNDFDVVICGDLDTIETAASRLAQDVGGQVIPVRADLATYDGVEELAEQVEGLGRPVDALLLNAGVGVGGRFLETSLDRELEMISLNISSVVHLAKRLVPAMAARGQGCVLITSSIAGTAPTPYMTVYGGTKAFDLSFAEGLRTELADSGVTVTALQPGATDTNFFHRADLEDTKVGQGSKDDPAEVARQGFEAMLAGKASIVAASLKSKMIGLTNEILPEPTKAKMQAAQTKPGSGKP